MRLFLCLFLGLVEFGSAFANPIVADFEDLKRVDVDYQIEGAVCEQVAKLKLASEFPAARYEIVTGISYGDRRRTIGELDVVVFDRRTRIVVLVGEVKCWQDLPAARRKAAEQQRRFAAAMASGSASQLFFAVTSKPEIQFDPRQFMSQPRLIAISQQGGERAGFERALDHNLDEFKVLREHLVSCQRQNRCSW